MIFPQLICFNHSHSRQQPMLKQGGKYMQTPHRRSILNPTALLRGNGANHSTLLSPNKQNTDNQYQQAGKDENNHISCMPPSTSEVVVYIVVLCSFHPIRRLFELPKLAFEFQSYGWKCDLSSDCDPHNSNQFLWSKWTLVPHFK